MEALGNRKERGGGKAPGPGILPVSPPSGELGAWRGDPRLGEGTLPSNCQLS